MNSIRVQVGTDREFDDVKKLVTFLPDGSQQRWIPEEDKMLFCRFAELTVNTPGTYRHKGYDGYIRVMVKMPKAVIEGIDKTTKKKVRITTDSDGYIEKTFIEDDE